MPFVELNRYFAPLRKDQPAGFEVGRQWGRTLGSWLNWVDLLSRRRVVLLAEASSGKSVEFRNQQERLVEQGKTAFFLRIEELADHGFAAALDNAGAVAFDHWRAGTDEGWFFLDSVDEARLVQKSFESALKRFGRELGDSLDRAHVFVSCRVTDWKGPDDRAAVERILPVHEIPAPPADMAPENALLNPIFTDRDKVSKRKPKDEKVAPLELAVVQLVPLSTEQYRLLAASAGVTDVDEFVAGIAKQGLEAFTERPGDVLDLADYWKTNCQFGRFVEMVEHGITRKLAESQAHRADNDVLSNEKARDGARRLAAALTFGKSFTLRAPHHDPDPSLAAGALDAAAILPDRTPAQRNALLRRGIFAPTTYGRVRFHHRSTDGNDS
jgi:hypothetical protein